MTSTNLLQFSTFICHSFYTFLQAVSIKHFLFHLRQTFASKFFAQVLQFFHVEFVILAIFPISSAHFCKQFPLHLKLRNKLLANAQRTFILDKNCPLRLQMVSRRTKFLGENYPDLPRSSPLRCSRDSASIIKKHPDFSYLKSWTVWMIWSNVTVFFLTQNFLSPNVSLQLGVVLQSVGVD